MLHNHSWHKLQHCSEINLGQKSKINLGIGSEVSLSGEHVLTISDSSGLTLGNKAMYKGEGGKLMFQHTSLQIIIEDQASFVIKPGAFCLVQSSFTVVTQSTLTLDPSSSKPGVYLCLPTLEELHKERIRLLLSKLKF